MSESGEMPVRPVSESRPPVTQRIKAGIATGVNKFLRKPQLTPEQQAENDLAGELIRKAELKHRPEREAREREDAIQVAEAQARLEGTLGGLHSATEALKPKPIPQKKMDEYKQKMAELDAKQESERVDRLNRVRAKVEQIRQENDDAEKGNSTKSS